ncbi:MAG: cytochrome P450 [Actinomycetota bacterium]|nr:cytochrome P450 [Actinomycetota bacterium]
MDEHLPSDRSVDGALALWAEGYTYISRRARRIGSDAFRTRMASRRVVCATGEEAVRQFYEPGRMTRRGAIPPTTLRLLQDKGSVQTLDGPAHRVRKTLFLELLGPDRVRELVGAFERAWLRRLRVWSSADEVVLIDQVREVLCDAVCEWAGVPIAESDLGRRARQLAAMVEGAGSIGPRNWRALVLRRRAERWAEGVVAAARRGAPAPPEDSVLAHIAAHRDVDGEQLPVDVAAVELLNVLRPTVAVGNFVVFAALALHDHPDLRPLIDLDDVALDGFVQEIRRTSPFFPALGGRVLEPFEWRGHRFERGSWMVLDLYGTNHDPSRWERPDEIRPLRHVERPPTAYDLVPQGGGDPAEGHRCPGELVTVELTKAAVRRLTTSMSYEVPPQNLAVDLHRFPAMPASGFVIDRVRSVTLPGES